MGEFVSTKKWSRKWRVLSEATLGILLLGIGSGAADTPAGTDKWKGLEFRELGPAVMGGRIDDFAVVESNPNIVFAGAASGGVWKTTNNGTTWEPVFDKEGVSTIGDIAIAPSDPSIVWVGTGEPNNRQSSSWGDGAYKSMDGGKTWLKMGLADTHHIGRIVIHPKNPDVVYGFAGAPSIQQTEKIAELKPQVADGSVEVKKLVDEDLPALNRKMNEAGIPHIVPNADAASPSGDEERD